jgi:acetolactate decarboxylase
MTNVMKFGVGGILFGAALIAADSVPSSGVMWQNMPLIALLNGYMTGNVSVRDALREGDFGLGAFADLDGEMVVIDGRLFQIPADGKPRESQPGALLSYAQIIRFRPATKIPLPRGVSFDTIATVLKSRMAGPNASYAVRITGTFSQLTARAPRKQQPPYPPFCEATKTQAIFHLDGREGTMAGFIAPGYLSTVDSAGVHLHFLSRDRQSGGHVLAFETDAATAELQRVNRVIIDTPRDPKFEGVPMQSIIACP